MNATLKFAGVRHVSFNQSNEWRALGHPLGAFALNCRKPELAIEHEGRVETFNVTYILWRKSDNDRQGNSRFIIGHESSPTCLLVRQGGNEKEGGRGCGGLGG